MKVAMMQPHFFPWSGYFELIANSDKFIFLDDFQFQIGSYHQRNRLFVNKGQIDWYTVPVIKHFPQLCNDTEIVENTVWRKKMWRRIEANYSSAPFFYLLEDKIKELILEPQYKLDIQNIKIIQEICRLLGYNKEFLYSSDYEIHNKRSAAVEELLLISGANTYLSAYGSFEYMYEDKVFPLKEIDVLFQNFQPKPYKQVGSKDNSFHGYLSVIDALVNVGVEETRELIENGTEKWLSWDEMIVNYINY